MLVNCLMKWSEMSRWDVKVPWGKVMGWFGAVRVLLPEICLIVDQSSDELVEWEKDSMCSIQVLRLFSAIVDAIWESSVGISGLDGFCERSWSRSRMRAVAADERPGVKLGMFPRGMCFPAAARSTRRKWASPDPQETGSDSQRAANSPSVSRVNPTQSALRKLMKVCRGRSGMLEEKTPPSRMTIGRWSELRVFIGVQSMSRVRWAVAKEMSGDDGEPLEGNLVGESVFKMEKELLVERSWR